MRPTRQLRKEHELLRGKLALLEHLLPLTQTSLAPARELTDAIALLLRCHVEEEAHLLEDLEECLDGPAKRAARHLPDVYVKQRRMLVALRALLAEGDERLSYEITACALHLIASVRQQMGREDEELFWAIEGAMEPSQSEEITRRMREASMRHRWQDEPPVAPACEL